MQQAQALRQSRQRLRRLRVATPSEDRQHSIQDGIEVGRTELTIADPGEHLASYGQASRKILIDLEGRMQI